MDYGFAHRLQGLACSVPDEFNYRQSNHGVRSEEEQFTTACIALEAVHIVAGIRAGIRAGTVAAEDYTPVGTPEVVGQGRSLGPAQGDWSQGEAQNVCKSTMR